MRTSKSILRVTDTDGPLDVATEPAASAEMLDDPEYLAGLAWLWLPDWKLHGGPGRYLYVDLSKNEADVLTHVQVGAEPLLSKMLDDAQAEHEGVPGEIPVFTRRDGTDEHGDTVSVWGLRFMSSLGT